ncbi:MAG: hypothetical protein TREMPRED_002002 [Tremellales sp. Tagirdzhanova-0007]|nr:MAG: hypothetical protein TREMPRED_002002 [Tremellales sp. Tagirdzhanova-0007]
MDDRLAFLRLKPSSDPPIPIPIPSVFEHRTLNAQGKVELQYWPARQGFEGPPAHFILFILGNPGLLNYYVPFLNHLHCLLPSTHAILSASHIGHSPSLPAPSESLDLQVHLEAKSELVRAIRVTLGTWGHGPRSRFALMGHSVGAWFLREVMKREPEGYIDAGYMLFPTRGWLADTWNGRTLWPIFRRIPRPLIPYLSALLHPVLSLTTFPPTTLSLFPSSAVIRHCLGLGKSEMDHIKEPDLEWLRSQRPDERSRGLFALYAEVNLDGWIAHPPSTATDLLATCTDSCAKPVYDSGGSECLRCSSPLTPYFGDFDTREAEHPNGPDRGVFEDAWQAMAGWLSRASSDPVDDLEEIAQKVKPDWKPFNPTLAGRLGIYPGKGTKEDPIDLTVDD